MHPIIQRAFFAPTIRPTVRTIAFVGSSSISNNHAYGASGRDRYNHANGFCNWMHAALQGRIEFTHNAADNTNFFGYWGAQAGLIQSTYAAPLAAAKPDLVVLYIANNDVSVGNSTGSILSVHKSFYHYLKANGCPQVAIMSVGPRNEAASATPGYLARRNAANKALQVWCQNEGILFYNDDGVNEDQATGEYLPGHSYDGTHLNAMGAAAKGIAMARWMEKTFNLGPSFFNQAARNALYGANPFLTGSPQATGFNRFPSSRITPTKVAATDGGHDWQQLAHAANSYADYSQFYYGASVGATYALPAGLAAGDYVRIVAEIEADNSGPYPNHGNYYVNVVGMQTGTVPAAANGNATTVHACHNGTAPGQAYEVTMPLRGVYCSPVMQLASDVSALSQYFNSTGGGTFRIRDFGFQKVNGYEPKFW